MYCKHCGRQLPDEAIRCPNCGKPVGDTSEADETSKEENYTSDNKHTSNKIYEYVIALVGVSVLSIWLLGKIGRQNLTIWLVISVLCSCASDALENIHSHNIEKTKGLLGTIPILIESVIIIIVCSALGHRFLGVLLAILSFAELPFIKVKLNGNLHQILTIATDAVGILTLILVIASYRHISNVKNGTPNGYPNITYGEAFNRYYKSPKWSYFKNDEGEHIIEFTGDFYYQETEVTALIQFTEYENEFSATYYSINNIPQNEYMKTMCLTDVFEEY